MAQIIIEGSCLCQILGSSRRMSCTLYSTLCISKKKKLFYEPFLSKSKCLWLSSVWPSCTIQNWIRGFEVLTAVLSEDSILLASGAVSVGGKIPKFRRNLVPSFNNSMFGFWRRWYNVPRNGRELLTQWHSTTSQKTCAFTTLHCSLSICICIKLFWKRREHFSNFCSTLNNNFSLLLNFSNYNSL